MVASRCAPLLTLIFTVGAQQIYIPVQGPSARPQCSKHNFYAAAIPSYTFRDFSFTNRETVRTATSAPAPTTMPHYAPPYESLSTLIPAQTTTQWGNWDPNATTTASGTGNPYGNASWTALWTNVPLPGYSKGIYSTTVFPPPIPSEQLVLPPPEYFQPQDCYTFPAGFELGVAASAVQIEGPIAEEGRSPAQLDVLNFLSNSSSNSVANENYYLYKQDIERIAAMGVKYFRFSVPWSRILPFALPGTPINAQGLAHYDDLINFVIEKGMQPAIVLHHNDSPFQFFNNATDITIAPGTDAFVNYGKIIMTHFADRVPIWWTFNEPLLGSRDARSVDAVMIRSHARLAHFYREEINGTGKISLTLNNNFGVPHNPLDPAAVDAASHFNTIQLSTFGNPIFLGLDYPSSFNTSFPDYIPLTPSDLAYINATADFLSIQPDTATIISPPPNETIASCAANITSPSRPYCVTQSTRTTTGWNIGYRSETYVYTTPTFFRTYLNYLWNTFRLPISVTEFGFPVAGEATRETVDQQLDSPRSQYYQIYMSEGLKAIWEDGVQWTGAWAWSFADNWEFGSYEAQFGVQTVNRTTMERGYKKSFFEFVDFVEGRRQKGEKS
ncbi:hypothetical protein KVT40_006801 [Elsinoe batatas]|uniref:Glycoside hydrolase family 1 protein n=1 Tax=Elsinoe batatas TaxID=2601811 RepID=A0A8K0PAV4_9PEZI|nr:hypothetical protein KVT40_006801 [Elsinoe batatas]